jgi:hypothetical protein
MRRYNPRLKNSAALRIYTCLRPTLCSPTRWSGNYLVLTKFLALRTPLLAMETDDDNEFQLPQELRTIEFKNQVKNYVRMLGFIEEATKALQNEGILLAEAQTILNTLCNKIRNGRADSKPWAFDCLLKNEYIGMESNKLESREFHDGIIKLQRDEAKDLTPDERAAVVSLKTDGMPVEEVVEAESEEEEEEEKTTLMEDVEKSGKQENEKKSGVYANPWFIPGSAAEIERLWSSAGLLMTSKRCSTTPQNFGAMIYLKYNRIYWDKRTVARAIQLVKNRGFNMDSDCDD